jgi:hypothetical protein
MAAARASWRRHFASTESPAGIYARLWSGQSFTRHAPDEHHIAETIAFLRFDASGAGTNARLTHLIVDASQHETETVFAWHGGSLHRVVRSPL